MRSIFTSESVTEGHPDKVSDRISDSVLDALLAGDKFSRVACETLTNTNLAVIAGEITSQTEVDYDKVVRQAIKEIGYNSEEMGYNFNTCDVKVQASADTMASEIGVLSPSPVLITNPRKVVEPGVDGGISFEGLTASFLSAVSISMLAYASFLVLIEESHPLYHSIELNHLFISVFFGFFGSVLDSFLGATLQNKGFLSNNGVNLASISISVLLSLTFLVVF